MTKRNRGILPKKKSHIGGLNRTRTGLFIAIEKTETNNISVSSLTINV
jgi:hypothetical protein